MSKQRLTDIADEAREFLETRKSLQLATVDSSGNPLASYTPFCRDQSGHLYILVSDLAQHGSNFDRGVVSVLAIADENESSQIFARRRIQFECLSEEILRSEDDFNDISTLFKECHGDIVDTLVSLSDFRLIRLTPTKGRYIRGFGQAYETDATLSVILPLGAPS